MLFFLTLNFYSIILISRVGSNQDAGALRKWRYEMDNEKKNQSMKNEMIRGLKFTLFSASAGIIEIVAFTLLNELTNWRYWTSYLVALILSVLWNFTLRLTVITQQV